MNRDKVDNQAKTASPMASILVPTYNRPQELKALLAFFKAQENIYPVYVLDGSDKNNQALNTKVVGAYANTTHIAFEHNKHLSLRIYEGLSEYVNTKYVIICADDDFIIPNFITEGIEFLESHPDYSIVSGQTKCLAYPRRANKHGFFTFLNHLSYSPALDQASFLERYYGSNILAGVGAPPIFYSLRRTEQATKIFSFIDDSFKYSSQELLNGALTMVWGKGTTLSSLMMIRNYSSITIREPMREDLQTYTTKEDLGKIRKIIKHELLLSKENLSPEQVEYILNQFFKLPLPRYFSYHQDDFITDLSRNLAYKKNWLFYLMNRFAPSFMCKLDRLLTPEILRSLRRALSQSATIHSH